MTPEAPDLCQGDGLKPELGVPSSMSHMDMRRLSCLEAVKEEPVPAYPQQRWHAISLSDHGPAAKPSLHT